MPQYLFDTDHLTLYQHKHAPLLRHIGAHPVGTVALSPVAIEEALRGRLAVLKGRLSGPARLQAYARLMQTLQAIQQFPTVPFGQAAEDEFQHLLSLHLRVGTQDLKIAAVALANQLTLLTRNRRDFGRVPNLMLDDWSA